MADDDRMPDRDALLRARGGDAAAFDALVGRHGARVLALARRLLRHREEAEDVAQEVFLRLFRTLDHVDPERPLEPWLVRLTVNAARSRAARRPQRRETGLPDEDSRPAAGADPFAALHARQVQDALRLAIAELPEREREVFVLRHLGNVEVGVIAEALGTSDVTVRRQSAEARRKVLAWFHANRPELVRMLVSTAPAK